MIAEAQYHHLSESQKSIWYLEKAYPGTSINIVAGTLRIRGNVCYPALQKALNSIVERNDSMRLRICEKDGLAMQYLAAFEPFKADFIDFSGGGLKSLFAWDEETTRAPFDIIDKPLFYCAVFKVSDDEGGAFMKIHHLISDAWTMGLLVRQVVEFYSAYTGGRSMEVSPNPSYLEHLVSEREYEKSPRFEKDRAYWNAKFETLPDMTVLKPVKTADTLIKARRKTLITPVKLSNKIREFCAENKMSPFTLFMSALSIYINRITGSDDIILGTTILNRTNVREKETTGMFVSVAAPVRIAVDNTADFLTFSKAMLRENTEVLRHQKYPYNYLVRELKKKHRRTDRLFDIVLSYQNSKLHKNETDVDYVVKWLFSGYQVESLVISINDRDDAGSLVIDYDFLTEVYDIKEIEFIHQHVINVLWHGLDNPLRKISKLNMISEKEKHKLLCEFNDTEAEYPRDKTIHVLFEEQAEKTPDSVALVFGDGTMTYRQLNEKANRLARTLRARGVGPDGIVGLLVDRSFEMIVAILGILKAGGAYLPIDPSYPEDRIGYTLADSGAKLLLTKRSLTAPFDGAVLFLDDGSAYDGDGTKLEPVNTPDDLAYIIYTSGSTGRPKGVMIEHRNVVRLMKNNSFQFDFGDTDVWTLFHSYSFDFSVWEMYGALLYGGRLVILTRDDVLDTRGLLKTIASEGVTVLNQTPSAFYNLIGEDQTASGCITALRYVIFGGEALKPVLLKPFYEKYPNTRLINMYGITETTVHVTFKQLSAEDISDYRSNIGKPIPTLNVHILDRYMNLQPIGIPGEIHVGGDGLARGYINNEQLTAEKFVSIPSLGDGRFYRSGDLGRRLPRGDIEYLGRIDSQVKIRGYRIELGEIENTLLMHPDVEKAVVVVRESEMGTKRLAAYYEAGKPLPAEALAAHLAVSLPDYMLPSYFVQVDEFPLNTNGKVDRARLPEPGGSALEEGGGAPRSVTELTLARIWSRVLGVGSVGVTDNFFFIGGDSLSAVAVAAQVSRQLEVELSPRDIFRYRTVGELACYVDSLARKAYEPIPNVEAAESYAVSSAQKRQYILNQLDGGISYNVPSGLQIRGEIDIARLEETLRRLIRRHEAFRTRFEIKNGEPVQIIEDAVDFSVEVIESEEAKLSGQLASFVRPFDLSTAPLFRARLVRLSEDRHLLLLDMHHIISDGASMRLILREFTELYAGGSLPALRVQYKDYSAWHNALLKSDKVKGQESYWLERFSGELPVLSLPLDYSRPASRSFKGETLWYMLDPALTAGLKKLAAERGTTLFMLLFSAYSVLLSRYTGQEDLIIGTPVEGRRHAELLDIVGMFVNTLALRTYPEGGKTFAEYLEEVKDELLSAYDNQEYPLEALVDRLSVRRDISRNPLFDTMFVLQSADWAELPVGDAITELQRLYNTTSKFDLTLEAVDRGETIEVSVEYSTDLFRRETAESLFSHYENALRDIIEHPAKRLHEIEILSDAERNRLLREFNDTEAEYPRDKTIHGLFEEQAEKTPDSVALVFGDETMTYRQLNEKANRLARTLRARGVGPDGIVGLLVDRSFEMIVAILGVLKAGGAYLPIDPSYPEDRIGYTLADSGAKLLLTKRSLAAPFDGTVLHLDDESAYDGDGTKLEPVNTADDLAYIIYTSGSTGRPKGVMTEHRNVVGLLFNDKFLFQFKPSDVFSLYHSYCFDLSAWEIYNALLRGCRLIIVPGETVKDHDLFMTILKNEKVSVLTQTPQSLYRLIDLEMKSEKPELALRYVITGGEALKPSLLKVLKTRYPSAEFFNQYGPTETTLYVTQKWLHDKADFETNTSNIGTPNPLTQAYVLDQYDNPVPIGIAGELCISGNGVSRGYINNPELTRSRFITNPFLENGLLYKTGDLVRVMTSGDIEYLGRIDSQVKIRGYRIELGEIENTLLMHPDVEKAVVVVRESEMGTKRLAAYYEAGKPLPAEALAAHLAVSLPDYMLPSYFVQVDEFPLNTNGKVDRARLPEPGGSALEEGGGAPRSVTELTLARIWSRVLGVGSVGVTDNFFFIGGDSLSAVAVAAQVSRQLEVELSPRDIFRYRTVGELACYVDSLARKAYEPIPNVEAAESYAVSSAQKRQYILNQLDGGISYNVPSGLQIRGEIDIARLEETLRRLIRRHEAFRTRFEIKNGEPVQIIEDAVDFSVEVIESEEAKLSGQLASFVRPFDLSTAPLFRARLVRLSEDRHLLLLDMHHIISDGASMRLILREFTELYAGGSLPALRVQYKDYSAWHNALLKSDKVKGQESYWLERFSGELPVLSLPLDYSRPASRSFKGETLWYMLDPALTAGLKKLAAERGTTLFMLLFSAYSVLLSRYTGQEDLIIGTPVEGRRHAELLDIVGMFVNTLALRTYPEGGKTFAEYLEEVKDELLSAYDNQEYPLEALVDRLSVRRDISRNPLFDTMFVLQSADWAELPVGDAITELQRLYNTTSKFDLTLEAVDRGETIEVSVEYSTDLFRRETAESLFSHYENALRDIIEHPAKRLHEIEILSDAERNRLLREFNDTEAEYPRDKTIHGLFEEQAEKTPDSVALVFGDETMTYRQLNEKANRLARTLRARGVGPDGIVGLLVDRSFEMIVAILGVLKAGGAYLPIDPSYPEDRIGYTLADSGAKLLLTKRSLTAPFDGAVLFLDDGSAYDGDGTKLEPVNTPDDLAYIIYTSGSTGRPKGVMIEHRNVVRLMKNNSFQFDFGDTDVWTLFHSYSFDFSVWEMYGALLYGGRLVILTRDDVLDTRGLLKTIASEGVTVLNQTPSAFYNLIGEDQTASGCITALRYVIFGGEALKPVLLKPFYEKYPNTRLINMYGITETTVHVTFKQLSAEDISDYRSNIGKPIPTLNVHILDRYMNLQPIGIPGEIHVGGDGLARGYINNEQLTAEKFVSIPSLGDGRFYRSGDLGRRLPRGDIEYLGRIDSQVKIRGYRIELGEIENTLLMHPDVEKAVVVVRESEMGTKRLAAYYEAGKPLPAEALAAHLAVSLPDYMLPSYFVQVDEFPLNTNGKVDRARLPEPGSSNPLTGYDAPRDVTEELIAVAWANVLELPTIGVNDNFFDLGGDSLSAVRVVSMLKLRINIVDFYLNPTIRQLADLLSKDHKKPGLLINMSRNYDPSNNNVICFPYGGGSALSYRDVSSAVKKKSAELNIYAVNLPGHDYGARDELQPLESVAEKLADEIKQTITGEIILYGHCAGTAPLMATAKQLEIKGVRIKAVFIGGILAPRFVKLYGWLNKLSSVYLDRYVMKYLRNFGVPNDILADNEYMQFMSRAFRYDRISFIKYFYDLSSNKNIQLDSPLYLIVGENDVATKRYKKKSRGWIKYYTSVELIVIQDADHYFIHTHPEILTEYLLRIP